LPRHAGRAASYTPRGEVATQTDGDGNLSRVGYNPLGEKTTETAPAVNLSEPASPPVATYSYDTLGDVTSVSSPLPGTTSEAQGTATIAYAYGFADSANSGTITTGTDSVSTWQGETLPQDSTSTTESQSWTFNNLALSNDMPGSSGDQTYSIYARAKRLRVLGNRRILSLYLRSALGSLGAGQRLVPGGHVHDRRDTDSTLVVSHSGSTSVGNVCLLQLTSTDTDDADGNLVSEVNATGATTSYAYNDLDC